MTSFLIAAGAFSVMALLRLTDLLSSGHQIDDEIWPILIRCGLQVTCNKIDTVRNCSNLNLIYKPVFVTYKYTYQAGDVELI